MFEGLFFSAFGIIFFAVVVMIIVNIVRGISQWNSNNASPVLTVDAKVVSKRGDISSHLHDTGNGHMHNHSSTTYYVTFEVQSGDRMELKVSGKQYGMIAEGDVGSLTFQGTRFHGFERKI